jgi:molybdate/tungstate transport system substrate-binding protein
VDVLYAGSLVDLMTNTVGPAFHTATGYTFTGTSGDSGTLANELKAQTTVGDVYISANPSKNTGLEGAANGNLVSWYAQFATSPLVLGYNPNSKFAQDLKTEPWYQVLAQPGILVGRTDPTTDPKGVLTVTALQDAAQTDNEPALATLATEASDVFPENTLVGRLQAGQLDVGFFYGVEAAAADIATVPLTGVPSTLEAKYTITVLDNAPHMAGGDAFVTYLLGAEGSAALAKAGMDLVTPIAVTGTPPASLQGVLSGG